MALHIITWLVSLTIHGGFAFGMLYAASSHVPEDVAMHEGTGDDIMVVEQGFALEGVVKLGEDVATVEAVQAPPVMMSAAQPLEQVEAVEEQEELPVQEVSELEPVEDQVIASEAGPETELLEPVQEELKEPEPEVLEQPLPQQMASVMQQTVIAMRESSGEEKKGGSATEHRKYLGAIRTHLERSKVNPRTTLIGTAIVRLTVKSDGDLLAHRIIKSSGSKILDDAALTSIARSAPFPPIPSEVGQETVEVSVPFKFSVR